MLILNLVLCSPDPVCDEMREILSTYLTVKKIPHFFYWYDPALQETHVFDSSTLRLSDKGSLLVQALRLTQHLQYDFVVCSNVSTVIDFDEQARHLDVGCLDYGGALYYEQISDSSEHGMISVYGKHSFVLGTHIVLSRKAVQIVLQHREIIEGYALVDDAALGVFFHSRDDVVKRTIGTISYSFSNEEFVSNKIMYSNKYGDPAQHVINMRMITSKLLGFRSGSVPKTLHQIWIGPCEPPWKYLDSWSRDYITANPHYCHKLWRDDEIEGLMLSNIALSEIYSAEEQWCGKADIARYYILYLFGGIYIDADSVWVNQRSLDPIVDTSGDLFMAMEPGKPFVASSVIGCTQYNVKVLQLVNRLVDLRSSYQSLRKSMLPWQLTGPLMLDILNPLHVACYYVCVAGKQARFTQSTEYSNMMTAVASTGQDCMVVKCTSNTKEIMLSLPVSDKHAALYKFLESLHENTTILPSYHFYPIHWSGITDSELHKKIHIDERSCMFQYGITTNSLMY